MQWTNLSYGSRLGASTTFNGSDATGHIAIEPQRDGRGKAQWKATIIYAGKLLTWGLFYSLPRAKRWAEDTIGRRVW